MSACLRERPAISETAHVRLLTTTQEVIEEIGQSPFRIYPSVNYSNFDPTIYTNVISIKGFTGRLVHTIQVRCVLLRTTLLA